MGSVADIQQSRKPSTTTAAKKEDELAEAIHRSPQKSTQHFAMKLISKWGVLKLLKTVGMKPYIPQLLQALNECNPDQQMKLTKCFLKT